MQDKEPKTRSPVPRLISDDPKSDRARRSKKHENRIANQLAGKRLPRSGGLQWSASDKSTLGGDIATPSYIIEHKRTQAESMSIKKEWLLKVKEGATKHGKEPMLVITFETPNPANPNEDWVAVPLSVWKRLHPEENK